MACKKPAAIAKAGCLQLLEMLEISWNLKSLNPGNFVEFY